MTASKKTTKRSSSTSNKSRTSRKTESPTSRSKSKPVKAVSVEIVDDDEFDDGLNEEVIRPVKVRKTSAIAKTAKNRKESQKQRRHMPSELQEAFEAGADLADAIFHILDLFSGR